MAQALREALDLVFPDRTAPRRGTLHGSASVDWERAYSSEPAAVARLVESLGLSVLPPARAESAESVAPRADSPLGEWLRSEMKTLEGVVHKIDELTDPKTGFVSEEALTGGEFKSLREVAESEPDRLIVEMRAWVDNAAALITTRRPMSDLLVAAKGGDDEALFALLEINAQLINVDAIAARVRDKVEKRDGHFLRRLGRAITSGPRLQTSAVIGFVVMALWEAGLKKLTYREIRGFLTAAGIRGVPRSQALERQIQRLGLRKYSSG
jgi:hypothetical protein